MNPQERKLKSRPIKSAQQQQQQQGQQLQGQKFEKTSNIKIPSQMQKKDLDESNEKEKPSSGKPRMNTNQNAGQQIVNPPPRQLSAQQLTQQTSSSAINSSQQQQGQLTSSNAQKIADQGKKNTMKSYKPLIDPESDEEQFTISIKKKKIEVNSQPVQQVQVKSDEVKQTNIITIPVAPLNINKCFQDILLQTSKDQNSLTMVKTILSAGSKKLADKQSVFKKTWTQLRNSNVSHEEYLKWEEQLKRNEAFDVKDIKETTIQRLINSKIRGFVSSDQLLEKGKKEYIARNKLEEDPSIYSKEFKLDEKQYEEFRNDQFTLLEKLMKENNLVAIDMMKPEIMKQAREFSNSVMGGLFGLDDLGLDQDLLLAGHMDKSDVEKQLEFLEDEENIVQKVSLCKYFETKNKPTETTTTQPSTTPNDNNGNKFYSSSDPYEIEKNIEKYSFQKIFKSYDDFIHLQSTDNCLIAKRVKSLLLDIKSDELFTDAKFQKEQFEKYQKLLKKINEIESFDINKVNDETLKDLVEIAAYIMNNVHYFQKFNLKCDLLHPLDLLYVTEKFLKQSNQNNASSSSSSSNSSQSSNSSSTSNQTAANVQNNQKC